MEVENNEYSVENAQRDRCLLRERYLRTVTGLVGKQCSFRMHGGQTLSGVYRGADLEFQNILADGLDPSKVKTDSAVLRSSDIIAITCNVASEEKKN